MPVAYSAITTHASGSNDVQTINGSRPDEGAAATNAKMSKERRSEPYLLLPDEAGGVADGVVVLLPPLSPVEAPSDELSLPAVPAAPG